MQVRQHSSKPTSVAPSLWCSVRLSALSAWAALPMIATTAALSLTGCAVGPDFKIPLAPLVAMTPKPLKAPGTAGSETQRFAHGIDIPGAWWRLFRSPSLNGVIERALRDNYDLKTAQAALRVAHANVEAQRGAFFPTIAGAYLP